MKIEFEWWSWPYSYGIKTLDSTYRIQITRQTPLTSRLLIKHWSWTINCISIQQIRIESSKLGSKIIHCPYPTNSNPALQGFDPESELNPAQDSDSFSKYSHTSAILYLNIMTCRYCIPVNCGWILSGLRLRSNITYFNIIIINNKLFYMFHFKHERTSIGFI